MFQTWYLVVDTNPQQWATFGQCPAFQIGSWILAQGQPRARVIGVEWIKQGEVWNQRVFLDREGVGPDFPVNGN